jgi:hypothetical protein
MSYRPLKTFTYSRPTKYGKKGTVNVFKYHGKKVKAYIPPSGRKLDAPQSILPKIQRAGSVLPYKAS